jgi:hypothetical protein
MRYIIPIIALVLACNAYAGNRPGIEIKEPSKRQQEDRFPFEQAEKMPARYAKLLDAIEKVETGGEKDPSIALGDHGKARGWMQIHADYYADAASQVVSKASNPLTYANACADRNKSRVIVCLYWRKYGVLGASDRDKALTHHYGPSGRPGGANNKKDPHGYWKKVQEAMK